MTVLDHRTWPTVARDIDDLLAVLLAGAHRAEPGAGLTQLQHALQCAELLQMTVPDDVELQLAGLLHDIGHALAPSAVEAHGRVGGAWVASLLGPRVAALIELHVPAKRYLVTIDPDYRSRLSDGSLRTLEAQGAAMTPDEVLAFEADPHHRDALTLRRADEGAKVAGIDAGQVADWCPTIDAVIDAARP